MKRLRKRRFIANISANLGIGLMVGSVLFPLSANAVSLGKALLALVTFMLGAILIATAVIFYE